MIPKDDRGFTLGDGLFETVLADHGRLVLWDEHLARLVRGCATLGLPTPDPRRWLAAAVAALGEAALGETRAAVRLTWTAGSGGRGLDRPSGPDPLLVVAAAPAPRPTGAVRLAISTVRRNQGSPASRVKSLSYLDAVLARREAAGLGADEAVMLNGRGELACASAANLFWLDGDILCTPALECGVLDGIMRSALMSAARQVGWSVREERAEPEALTDAAAVFVTNSLIGVRPAASLDGRPLRSDDRVAQLAALVAGVS